MNTLAVTRAPQFSPNAIENDRAIMQAVVCRLQLAGHDVIIRSECELSHPLDFDICITMGRKPETLAWLRRQSGRIVNTPDAVSACSRSNLTRLMHLLGFPTAPDTDQGTGFWLKRGDACAQQPDDVMFCQDETALALGIEQFKRRGITNSVVSAHVEGDLVKFYGVRGTDFFRYFYPTDDGQIKFGNERHNGPARHYPFSLDALHHDVTRLAAQVGIDVYGGDCIVRADGSYCIIDFNDWPSFSRCLGEAAKAIVQLIMERAV